MGVDISIHVEKRVKGKWENIDYHKFVGDGFEIAPIYDGRNYPMFGALAGIGGHKPIDYPRGMPGDATELTRLENRHMAEYNHTHSYYSLAELIIAKRKELKPLVKRLKIRMQDEMIDKPEDIRVVFWFDS